MHFWQLASQPWLDETGAVDNERTSLLCLLSTPPKDWRLRPFALLRWWLSLRRLPRTILLPRPGVFPISQATSPSSRSLRTTGARRIRICPSVPAIESLPIQMGVRKFRSARPMCVSDRTLMSRWSTTPPSTSISASPRDRSTCIALACGHGSCLISARQTVMQSLGIPVTCAWMFCRTTAQPCSPISANSRTLRLPAIIARN